MLKGRQVSKAEENRMPSGNDGMEMWTWVTDRRSRAEAAEWRGGWAKEMRVEGMAQRHTRGTRLECAVLCELFRYQATRDLCAELPELT
jgi:hypothetical protein